MNVSFEVGDVVNGFMIVAKVGLSRYVAANDEVSIMFDSDAGAGKNLFKIISYTNKITKKSYRSPRYTLKYVPTVRELSAVLYAKYRKENNNDNK